MENVVLIDGNNILFRSYYATMYSGNTMKNSKGFSTNALYGLINMLNKIINEEKPNYIMIALDKGKTFRHDKYQDYKAGRIEMPDDLKLQFSKAKEIINALGIKYYEIDNYEADDIIGTFASMIDASDDLKGVIISSDKDLLQLISDKVEVKLLKTSDYVRMNEKVFYDIYGIKPIQMIDLKSLMGDASDNIKGVKGIGEKTALTLLKEYNTIDNLYENIDKISGKVKEKLVEGKLDAFISKDLVTICKDVPIDTSLDIIKYNGVNLLQYVNLLEDLEFYSIIKKLDFDKNLLVKNEERHYSHTLINDINDVHKEDGYSIYLEIYGYSYQSDMPIGLGLSTSKDNYYIPFSLITKDFFNDGMQKYTYDLKKLRYVFNNYHLNIDNNVDDLMIILYLLNYNTKNDISLVMKNFNYDVISYDEEFGNLAKLHMPSNEELEKNVIIKSVFIYEKYQELIDALKSDNVYDLYKNIELPLVYVLCDMELVGVKIDIDLLKKSGREIKEIIDELEKRIFEIAGFKFNILSFKQLGDTLFNKLGIPYPKKGTVNEFKTSKDILDKLIDYPIVALVLEYRTYTKIYNNYICGLIDCVKNDGRLHTTYNQTLTRTGRLSSENPNLQNIPIRKEEGKIIRKAFLPSTNNLLISFDYSQIELRIFAHMSGASNLIEAFNNGIDIHKKTAADIFNVDVDSVSSDMRRTAKAVNFGILYGISSFGLSEGLNINVNEAKKFIDKYLETYPGIKEYMSKLIEKAKEDGYVLTLFNRKRVIDEIKNKNYMIRSQGERMALNTPIQGTSADILKKAMVEIFEYFNKHHLKSKIILQIHDELIIDTVKEEEKEVIKVVKDIMENTCKLNVKLEVDINSGSDWYDAK